MLQVVLKNNDGNETRIINSLDELASVLNDQLIKRFVNPSDIIGYIMRNHFRVVIDGVTYYNSAFTSGENQPTRIVYTELSSPSDSGKIRIILEDKNGSVVEDRNIEIVEMAALLNDPQIMELPNPAILEFYLVLNHYRTTIHGESYQHKEYSSGVNQLPTFRFVKF